MHSEPPLKPEWLDAWSVEPAAKSLEDRVWRRFERRQKRTRRLKGLVLLSGAISALVVSVVLFAHQDSLESGPLRASGRTSWSVAGRAVAVAEDGSRLSWSHGPGGTHIHQESGDVFYRVDRGGPFEVRTAMGSVRALGTCFRVRVEKPRLESSAADGRGSASAGVVLVSVYEGRVALSDQRSLSPGQTAELRGGSGSARAEVGAPQPKEHPSRLESAQEQIRTQTREILRLRDQLAQLRGSIAQSSGGSPSGASDDSLGRRFEAEVRDDTWATTKEALLTQRMAEYMGVPRDKLSIECRRTCCDVQVALRREHQLDGLLTDFKSSVGIGMGHSQWTLLDVLPPRQSRDGAYHIYACSKGGPKTEDPVDRGLERKQLLARAAPHLERCRRTLRGPLDVELRVQVDRYGAISDVQTTADPPGEPTTKCVEEALLSAAHFAPASHSTWFPIRITLQGP